MTARVCKALSHPAVTMLGHATGRLLLRRAGYKIDLDAVLQAAAEHGKMIEINAQPYRLDLDWTVREAGEGAGHPDRHQPGRPQPAARSALTPYGVNVARRGWLTKDDVFNTRSYKEMMKELARRKAAFLASRSP